MRVVVDKATTRVFGEVWEIVVGLGLAFVLYAGMSFAFHTPVPLTAVVSDSMEPNYYKGDMLVVYGSSYGVGDVVVYENPRTSLPIVHRVVNVTDDGRFITKGDNNPQDDVSSGITPAPVGEESVLGKSVLRVPYLGWIKILFMRYVLGFKV
ncbi:MAG: signal peptidase I [archaeon]